MKYLLSLLLSLCVISPVFADLGGYTIQDYHVDMQLNQDASMDVTETIQVNFSEPRHGIYRDIPTQDNRNNYITLQNISVDSDPINNISYGSKKTSIKIGDANKTISGPKTYTIRYQVKNAITMFSGGAELYRNIIGTERATSIKKASWSINLPKKYARNGSGISAVWGSKSSQNTQNIKFFGVTETQRRGTLESPLQSYQGITIAMLFSSDYFSFPAGYERFFINKTNSFFDIREYVKNNIYRFLFQLAFLAILPVLSIVLKKGSKPYRKSDRPVTIQYNPPEQINPSLAFYLWYYDRTPRVFITLIYYWCTRGRATLQHEHKKILGIFNNDTYHVVETSNNPQNTTELDRTILQDFFGIFDTTNDDIALEQTKKTHQKFISIVSCLDKELRNSQYLQKKDTWRNIVGAKELSPAGREVFEQMRGYKEFLTKVERPVIEQELKSDPEFLNKILPWAVLFGVETKLLKMIEDLLKDIDRYQSNNGGYLTYHTMNAMNNSMRSFTSAPRSSGGGSSGGGGGGGGGGSW